LRVALKVKGLSARAALPINEANGNSRAKPLSKVRKASWNMSDPREKQDQGTALEEARPEVRRPPLFRVVMLNDDFTPMEFVVEVLERFFGLDRTRATRIMLEVHTRGRGVCGVFPYDIAETRVVQVTDYARQHQHPLMCTMEEA
jgi:ATP-dependent Clp protease adaptor protein ClpS